MRKNIITIAALALTLAGPAACGPDAPSPDTDTSAGTSTSGDATGAMETSAGPGEGGSSGSTGGASQDVTGAATGGEGGSTGGASWGEPSTGDTSTSGDSSSGDASTSTGGPVPGDSLACEGDPCVTHEDCKAGLELLMCWPIGAGVCMEACDPMDAQACGGEPDRCQAWPGTPVFLCQPLIPKAPNNTGKCVPK